MFYSDWFDSSGNISNKKYVLWNVYLPIVLHSVCLNRLSCTEVGIYNGANSSHISVPGIWSRSQISKGKSREPFTTPFDLILHLCAKFEVSTFNRSRDMEGSQNCKSRSHNPSRPRLT